MPSDYRTQVLQATDLVELVSQTVALKRRGKSFVGLCPFHQEKTPSFHVDPSKQFFICFGCKASGTAFDFVMKRDRVEFKEALHVLARRAGIDLPEFGASQHKPGERQALLDAHSAACRFFENLLWQEEQGAAAREYLRKRGFTEQTIKRFQIGLAADAWDALLKGPVGRKYPPQLLALGGLVKPRQQGEGFYDTFRNRIMFPIRNEGGQIIAFGGRVLPGSSDPAKYLNSPETPLFSKSRAIFGLDFARQRIVETRSVAVVEGYADAVMAHQFGASNVISVLGTAMTEQHVGVLRRFADKIVLLFDADAAGDAAVDRVVQLFLTQPVEIAVASVPDGLDPDEFLLRDGVEVFDKLLLGASDALSYAWKQMRRQYIAREGDLTAQQKAVQEYLELLAKARGSGPVDPLRWGAALVQVSKLTEIPAEDLNRRFKARKVPRPAAVKAEGGQEPTKAVTDAPGSGGGVRNAQESAERQILGLLLIEPRRWQDVQKALQAEDFVTPGLRELAEVYWNHQRDEGEPVFNEFLSLLTDARVKALAIELVQAVEDVTDREVLLREGQEFLASLRQKQKKQKLVAALLRRGGEQPLSAEEEAQLLRELEQSARRPDLRRGL